MNDLDQMAFFTRHFMKRKVDLPVRSSDMGLLIFIFENKRSSASNATRFFDVSKAMISAMLKRVEEEGYVIREKDPIDKRKQYLTLSIKGEELVKKSKKKYKSFQNKLRKEMGEESYHNFLLSLEEANQAIRRINQCQK